MDVAKLVAFLNGQTTQGLDDIYGVGACVGKRLPLVQIPTTAGTGSEVTPVSIVTTGDSEKKGVVSPQLYADIALLDGQNTLGLPRHVTVSSTYSQRRLCCYPSHHDHCSLIAACPNSTFDLSANVCQAATGVDAMVHAVEAYTSRHLKNPMSDLLAREALKLLGANIRAVCDESEHGGGMSDEELRLV